MKDGLKLGNTSGAEPATEKSWLPNCGGRWRHSPALYLYCTPVLVPPTPIVCLLKTPLKLTSSPAWENHCPSVLGRNMFQTYVKVEISMFVWTRNSKMGLSSLRHTMLHCQDCQWWPLCAGFFSVFQEKEVTIEFFPFFLSLLCKLLDKEGENLNCCGQELLLPAFNM